MQISRLMTAQLITAFVFATYTYFLNPKFQASSRRLVCTSSFVFDLVGDTEDRFSQDPAHDVFQCAVDSVSRDYDTEDERQNIKDGRFSVF